MKPKYELITHLLIAELVIAPYIAREPACAAQPLRLLLLDVTICINELQ
jgi:hypothetical protein